MSKNNHIIKGGAREHAALIHAWADGAEIQAKNKEGWVDICGTPAWFPDTEYRVKPKTRAVKFRNYLNKDGLVYAADHEAAQRGSQFVKWIGYWQEVEVEL